MPLNQRVQVAISPALATPSRAIATCTLCSKQKCMYVQYVCIPLDLIMQLKRV